MFSVVLEIDPVPKERPRLSRYGHAFTPAKTRNYESAISAGLRSVNPPEFVGPVAVLITFNLKKAKSCKTEYPTKRPDLDNLEKAVLDAMNGIMYKDDSQVVYKASQKLYSDRGSIEISVCAYPFAEEDTRFIDPKWQ